MIDKYQILSPDEFKAFVNEKGLIDRGEGDRHIFLYDKNDNRYHFKYEMVEPDMEEHFMYLRFDTKEEVLKRKEAARLNPLTIEDLKNDVQKHLDHFKNIKPLHQCFDDIETAERLYYNGLLSFSAFNTINEYNNRLASVLIDRLVEAFATLHYPNIDLREAL